MPDPIDDLPTHIAERALHMLKLCEGPEFATLREALDRVRVEAERVAKLEPTLTEDDREQRSDF